MNFISEEAINDIIVALDENEALSEQKMEEFSENQPFLLSFLLSESFNILDETEKSLLFYLALVIYSACSEIHSEMDTIELDAIENADENNWTLVDQHKFKTLKEIADFFFQDYPQEDLLAFVEDSLIDDEENDTPISNIGRNVIFVSMKSFIDCLHQE